MFPELPCLNRPDSCLGVAGFMIRGFGFPSLAWFVPYFVPLPFAII